ncbi:MAG: efflux RND transporter periplasmic adaptor subunit [Flavobacteriales bacterium]|nr:efflux RND transporter periplasmic adaptor subunit [Flavobacteriales bacterium]
MKKAVLALSTAAVLVSCGSGEQVDQNIEALQQRKDSLKTIYEDIAAQIALVDEQLKALDTTIVLPLVTTKTVENKPFAHFVEIQGAVETGGNATIYPEAMGTITSIVAKEGQKVNQGDVILRIDAGMIQSTLKEVETNYELANEIFEKQERLWKQKIGSEVDYLKAKTNKEALEQKQKTLREQLEMYVVRAPFSGTLDEIMPKVGEAANPAMPVARVINYDNTYIEADVSEDYITTIKEGTLAKVYFPSLGKEIDAKIDRTGSFINPKNRTFKIHISLNELKENLQPNLLGDIRIRDFFQEQAIVIPSNVIQQDRQGNEYIYLLEIKGAKRLVKKAVLKSGLSYDKETIVLSGLEGDEVYIDKGARSVQTGDEVDIMK